MSKEVCLCKHITEETIVEAVKNGADTLEKVKETTKAAAGCCKGRRCADKIEEIIEENK